MVIFAAVTAGAAGVATLSSIWPGTVKRFEVREAQDRDADARHHLRRVHSVQGGSFGMSVAKECRRNAAGTGFVGALIDRPPARESCLGAAREHSSPLLLRSPRLCSCGSWRLSPARGGAIIGSLNGQWVRRQLGPQLTVRRLVSRRQNCGDETIFRMSVKVPVRVQTAWVRVGWKPSAMASSRSSSRSWCSR